MVRKVEVVPHNPDWAKQFAQEADDIGAVWGDEVIAIHHIGSTAIPSIKAKPIIDMLVEVRDIEKLDEYNAQMMALGYEPKREHGIPRRRFFAKGGDIARTHHVHVFQVGDAEITRHLNFRDYMLAHPEAAQAYSLLKEELARKYAEDIEGYIAGKDAFIKEMDEKTAVWIMGH